MRGGEGRQGALDPSSCPVGPSRKAELSGEGSHHLAWCSPSPLHSPPPSVLLLLFNVFFFKIQVESQGAVGSYLQPRKCWVYIRNLWMGLQAGTRTASFEKRLVRRGRAADPAAPPQYLPLLPLGGSGSWGPAADPRGWECLAPCLLAPLASLPPNCSPGFLSVSREVLLC